MERLLACIGFCTVVYFGTKAFNALVNYRVKAVINATQPPSPSA